MTTTTPACSNCSNDATCFGTYENRTQFSCDDCCGHACEDGHCDPLKGALIVVFSPFMRATLERFLEQEAGAPVDTSDAALRCAVALLVASGMGGYT